MSKPTQGALEWLAAQAGVLYLSDLRPQYRKPALSQALRQALEWVDPDRFPAASWADAVAYLLDQPGPALSSAKAVDLLWEKL